MRHRQDLRSVLTRQVDFATATDLIPSGIVLTDHSKPDSPIVFVNSAFTAITGYSLDEVAGRNCRFLQGPATDARSVAAVREALSAGKAIKIELLNYRKNGEAFWNELSIAPQTDAAGRVIGFIGIQADVTARRKHEAEMKELEARLASIIQNLPGYVFQRTLKSNDWLGISAISPSFANILGVSPGQETAVSDIWKMLLPEDRELARQGIARSAATMSPLVLEFRIPGADGGQRWVRTYSNPRRLDDGDVIWDGIGLDVTAEKTAESRLSYLAYHDPLTGMPNRLLLGTSLLQALKACGTTGNRVALFKLDVDGFQEINDAVGAQVADTVLRSLAKRVAGFAEQHAGYSARTGGDEFAVFFTVGATDGPVADAAAELCRDMARPLIVAEQEFLIETCVGVAIFPFPPAIDISADELGVSELMKQAKIALQAAQRAGRGMHRVYSVDSDDRRRNEIVLRQSLRKAISDQQFRLHYHPLVDLASGAIVGAEALVRWDHPTLGLQRPDIFIPLAERSGLIAPLGGWVFLEAMRQAQEWEQSGLKVPRISINVSGLQLLDPSFLDTVQAALAQSGAQSHMFELELTEGFMIEASPTVLNVLRSLKRLGFTLAIDDFGTGHASFAYLRNFPVDKVKIDQMFVRQMVIDSSDASIIRAIIAVAKNLKLDVVAEGIETTAQRDFLRDEGCKIGQGYLFSLPLAAEDFGFLLSHAVRLPMGSETDASAPAESEVQAA